MLLLSANFNRLDGHIWIHSWKAVFHLNKPCFWIEHFGNFLGSPVVSDSKNDYSLFNKKQSGAKAQRTARPFEMARVCTCQTWPCPSLCLWNKPRCNEGRATSLHPAVSKHLRWHHTCGSSTQKDNWKTACSNNWSNLCGLWSTWHNCPPMPAIAWEMKRTYSRLKANHLKVHCQYKQDDSWNYWRIHPANTGSIKTLGPKLQIVQGEQHAKAHWKACTIRRGSTMGL